MLRVDQADGLGILREKTRATIGVHRFFFFLITVLPLNLGTYNLSQKLISSKKKKEEKKKKRYIHIG